MLAATLILFACDNIEKLDKQLYDSTESTVPITKLDQLEEIDKAAKANDPDSLNAKPK